MQKHSLTTLAILSFILICLQCDQSATPEIQLFVFPENGGTVISSRTSYSLGDDIEFRAQPLSGHYFYKWTGDTISYDSVLNYTVTSTSSTIGAVFADTVIADGRVIIGNFPDTVVNARSDAVFELGLDLPLDSTYTVYCTCDKYDHFTFSMLVPGNALFIHAGCQNDTASTQSNWYVSVRSDKSDSFVVRETINYKVQWK